MFSPACYSFINYLPACSFRRIGTFPEQNNLTGGGKVQTWTSDPLFMLPRLSSTAAPKWEATPQSHSHPSVSSQNPFDPAHQAASCRHRPTLPTLPFRLAGSPPQTPTSSAVVSSKAASSKPQALPQFCLYPLPPVCFFQMGTPSLKKSMELFLRKKWFVLTTPPKRNRSVNKIGKWGRTTRRVFLVDPGGEMQFVVPSVNTSLSEETGVSSQNMRKHISVALANRFVSYMFPRKPGVHTAGEVILSSQFVCSAWPNFCLHCYEAFSCALWGVKLKTLCFTDI